MSSTQAQIFLSSRQHLIGCISTIVGYVMIWMGVITWSWLTVLIIFYSAGWFAAVKIFPSDQNYNEKESSTDLNVSTSEPVFSLTENLPTIQHKDSHARNKISPFIDDFLQLKITHQLELPYSATKILNEIYQILLMLYQQTETRNDVFSLEINKTQKIVYEYLQPTIENYLKIPRYYASNRIINDEKTAKDLLIEQLELLKNELYTMLDNILADNLTGLTLHAEFLNQKLKPYQFFKIEAED